MTMHESRSTVLHTNNHFSKPLNNDSIEDQEIVIDDDTVAATSPDVAPSPLHILALNGNRKQLQECIASGKYDINGVDNMGRTPLICSVLVEQVDCVNLLLKMGADIDQPDDDGRTALHWAAYQGNEKLVKLIIGKCKNRATKDKEGRTPLHLSISHDNIKVLQILLKYFNEQEYDAADYKEMTALCWSVSYERIEHTKLLLKNGATTNKLDNESRSILHWTSQNKSPDLIKLLLEEGCQGINFQDKEGRTLLHMAVGHGNYSIVQFLLTLDNIEVNRQDGINVSPLHWAAILGLTPIVELLLNNGADYSLPDNNGARALHYAARATRSNSKDVVAAMLKTGKVTDEPDNELRTALMWAAAEGNFDVLEVLLKNKCGNINAMNSNQQTALHITCQAGHLECAKLLINFKADINMMDKQRRTALFYACASGYAEIVSLLLDQENQRNLHERDLEGRTPLHFSARVNRRDIIKTLIQHGLDPNAQDEDGCTPLHIAANGGFVHCMNVLLENGAYVNMQNACGCTALHLASRSGILDAVKLLVNRYSANVNITDFSQNNLTCLNYAILEDHQDVAFFLIENGAYIIAALHDKAAKIQATWRGYICRKRQSENWKQSRARTNTQLSVPSFHETQNLNKHSSTNFFEPINEGHGVNGMPPVSPSHQIVPGRPASHIGVPTSLPVLQKAKSTHSLVSGLNGYPSRSSFLSPDKSKYGLDHRQGPKFYEDDTNPFSLNRVTRVKSPVSLTARPRSTSEATSLTKLSDNVFTVTKESFKFHHHSSKTSINSDFRPNLAPNETHKKYVKSDSQSTPSVSSESAYFRAHSIHKPLPQISLTNEEDSSDTSTINLERPKALQPQLQHIPKDASIFYRERPEAVQLQPQYIPKDASTNNLERPNTVPPPPQLQHMPKPPSRPRKVLTQIYTMESIQNEENGNKPWNVYRRDQKRINVIRKKIEAAAKIQAVYREYRRKKLQNQTIAIHNDHKMPQNQTFAIHKDHRMDVEYNNENDRFTNARQMSEDTFMDSETDSFDTTLSNDEIPNEDTLKEIAALVIQAAWRQYVKAKLISEARLKQVAEDESIMDEDVDLSEANNLSYTYEVKRPKRQLEEKVEIAKAITDDDNNIENEGPTDSKSKKKSAKGKTKLHPSQSFPLMENIYQKGVRVKRTRRFSLKKHLLRSTTVDPNPLKNGELENLSSHSKQSLKAGKPKVFLAS